MLRVSSLTCQRRSAPVLPWGGQPGGQDVIPCLACGGSRVGRRFGGGAPRDEPRPGVTTVPATTSSRIGPGRVLERVVELLERRRGIVVVLLVPTMLFLAMFFVLPIVNMVKYSVYSQPPGGQMVASFTLENYARFFRGDVYRRVLFGTLRISLFTTLAAVILGYPTAIVMARGGRQLSRVIAIIVISPLLVNVVIRTYGWRIILNRSGLVNWVLIELGLIREPLDILYNEFAIVVGSLHVFFPLMVLPLAAALGKVDPSLEEVARTLGAHGFHVFRRVTLPLSLPGLVAGASLVFSLTASSFVTPALLGGEFAKMLGTLVQEQLFAVFDWPFGAAIATVLMMMILVVVLAYMRVAESRFRGFSMVTQ